MVVVVVVSKLLEPEQVEVAAVSMLLVSAEVEMWELGKEEVEVASKLPKEEVVVAPSKLE